MPRFGAPALYKGIIGNATSAVRGLMSAVDKAILDALQAAWAPGGARQVKLDALGVASSAVLGANQALATNAQTATVGLTLGPGKYLLNGMASVSNASGANAAFQAQLLTAAQVSLGPPNQVRLDNGGIASGECYGYADLAVTTTVYVFVYAPVASMQARATTGYGMGIATHIQAVRVG